MTNLEKYKHEVIEMGIDIRFDENYKKHYVIYNESRGVLHAMKKFDDSESVVKWLLSEVEE